jgi:hypothetical protein
MPRNPNKTPCNVPGCKAWAIRGSDPPLCSPHSRGTVGAPPGNQNRRTHGFYANVLRRDELADLVACAGDTTLDAEIAITRVALRRALAMLLSGRTPGPDPHRLDATDVARLIGLAFRGAGAISRLLRARQALAPDSGEPFLSVIHDALDKLGEEWGAEL